MHQKFIILRVTVFQKTCQILQNSSNPQTKMLEYTHTHPFNGPFSWTTQVSQYQKGKPIWTLLKQETVSGSGISWAICKSAPRSRQITTPAPTTHFLQAGCPSYRPTNSIKALKAMQKCFIRITI